MKKYERPWLVYSASLLFLFILIFIVYANSFNNGFVSDDMMSIAKNKNISKIEYIFSEHTNILRNFLYFTVNKLFGLEPFGFRLINVFFHLGSTWSLFAVSLFFSHRKAIALVASSLFAVHPILTESVTWISGGSYVQYSFFLLLALLPYIKSHRSTIWYLLSVSAFFLSLNSSEKALIFPLILASWEISQRNLRAHWKKLFIFFILSLLWGIILMFRLNLHTAILYAPHIQNGFSLNNPVIRLTVAVSSYLQLILWPNALTLYHSEFNYPGMNYMLHLFIFVSFIVTVCIFYIKDRLIFFWMIFFIVSLGVTLIPLQAIWIVAERYVYLGTSAFSIIFTIILYRFFKRNHFLVGYYLLCTGIIIILGYRTILRNRDWKSEDTLWLATARTSPLSPQNHNNLGDYYARHKDYQTSIREFKKAIELNPQFADAYHNLGVTYTQIKDYEKAQKAFFAAININSRLWQSYQNLASIAYLQKNYQTAEEYILEALIIDPGNKDLQQNLYQIRQQTNRQTTN